MKLHAKRDYMVHSIKYIIVGYVKKGHLIFLGHFLCLASRKLIRI